MDGERKADINITFTKLALIYLEKVKARFSILVGSVLSLFLLPHAWERNTIFTLWHQFPHLLFMPTLSLLSQITPPSLHPLFTVTWLHLMMRLTPAYRIKLISTKQGSLDIDGGEKCGVVAMGERKDYNNGSEEKYSRKKAQ